LSTILPRFYEFLLVISKLNRPSINHPILEHGYAISNEKLNEATKYLLPNPKGMHLCYRYAKRFSLAMGTSNYKLSDIKQSFIIFTNWIVAISAYYGVDTVTYFEYSPESDSCKVNLAGAENKVAPDQSDDDFIYAEIVVMADLEADYDESEDEE
jgi:hypothetical protein